MSGYTKTLERAKGFIAGGFVKGVLARTAEGRVCSPFHERERTGVSFCVEGALMAAVGSYDVPKYLHEHLAGFLPLEFQDSSPRNANYDLVNFNNHPTTTQSDVVALFDRAINAST